MAVRKIELDAQVEHGRLVLVLPPGTPDGHVHVVVTLTSDSVAESVLTILDRLQPLELMAWSPESTFSREDLYNDDGR